MPRMWIRPASGGVLDSAVLYPKGEKEEACPCVGLYGMQKKAAPTGAATILKCYRLVWLERFVSMVQC